MGSSIGHYFGIFSTQFGGSGQHRMLLLDLALKKKIHDINISSGKKYYVELASNSYSTSLLTLNQFDRQTTDARNDELIFRVCTFKRGAVATYYLGTYHQT